MVPKDISDRSLVVTAFSHVVFGSERVQKTCGARKNNPNRKYICGQISDMACVISDYGPGRRHRRRVRNQARR